MDSADRAKPPGGQSSVDLLVVGGGIMGLWATLKAGRRGLKTLLIDEGSLAGGASGGLLGALMSHTPDKWNEKKQFQFDALLQLEDEVVRLEAETGLAAGYRRCGRLIPLPKDHLRPIALRYELDAKDRWRKTSRSFEWAVRDAGDIAGWPDAGFTKAGIVHDTFAARVSPRRLAVMLVSAIGREASVSVREDIGLEKLDPVAGFAELTDGKRLSFGHVIVAAGHRSFPLLGAGRGLEKPLGQPVKGQAALIKADIDPDWPLLYLDGLYIVPHDDGTVAIGSTSENSFGDPLSTDEQLDALIASARQLAPVLTDGIVVERWAGLRPKAIGRDPMIGPDPEQPRIVALTGGFKVSFGLAHKLADAALDAVEGKAFAVPESFRFESHLDLCSRKT
ncbi:FAD-binding oxidoreductase [Ciceribacter sp. L1K23]|uniref:NAD(P)/FAD-dependent oxidoreductase n=1 Tax=Ciceribacter sp. L1K23 TaxID=2820276 RepID=UPI001B835687|nr:FAD-binding oxidoreductase [Ciceribacter sp. L1K23]MBR0554710.1 FAD-binding oxidoreductase [Ciceribacter sp. L1K23]